MCLSLSLSSRGLEVVIVIEYNGRRAFYDAETGAFHPHSVSVIVWPVSRMARAGPYS